MNKEHTEIVFIDDTSIIVEKCYESLKKFIDQYDMNNYNFLEVVDYSSKDKSKKLINLQNVKYIKPY